VGSVYFSAYEDYPFNGWGNWVRVAEGRHIVGIGTGTDTDNRQHSFYIGNDIKGTYTVTLSSSNIPTHYHYTGGVDIATGLSGVANLQSAATYNKHQWWFDGHPTPVYPDPIPFQSVYPYPYEGVLYGYFNRSTSTIPFSGIVDTLGSQQGWRVFSTRKEWDIISNITTTSGGGQPHNNMPPTYGLYCWQRLAD
jgi:microcystin-dependent protein